ncbi:MAG: hypothetical protein K2K54_11660 [Lachnospiraceae bacterium]|nr:hypothetical protein [Lachnospiraceae bacterium]
MDKEIVFAKTLQEVLKRAKENGNCIAKEEVEEAFSAQNLTKEQMDLIFDYLNKHKVGIGEPVDPDDYLGDEDRNYLEDYLQELQAIPSVSEGEKEAITISAMAGDQDAQKRLIEIYIPKVVEVAKLYAGQGIFIEDLIGEGNLAVALGVTQLGCLEHQSEAEGMLAKLMMDAMEDAISEHTEAEELDRKIVEKVNEISGKANELAEDLKRKVTPEELAEETGIPVEDILEAVRISGNNIEDIDYKEAAAEST